METKFCPKCKTLKSRDDFRPSPNRKDGLNGWCKICKDAANKKWMQKNPLKVQRYQKKCRLRKDRHITLEEYEKKEKEQNYLCALCRQPETTLSCVGLPGKRLAVDHDHMTGMNRALLCHLCNTGLGAFKDSPELLQRAIDYLKKYSENDHEQT